MTNQEAFDGVWQWFVVERHGPGVRTKGASDCVMYVNDETKCAVGSLIPYGIIERLSLRQTSMGIRLLLETNELVRELFQETNLELLSSFQVAHDCATRRVTFLDTLENNLRDIAARFNLLVPKSNDQEAIETLIKETTLETATIG